MPRPKPPTKICQRAPRASFLAVARGVAVRATLGTAAGVALSTAAGAFLSTALTTALIVALPGCSAAVEPSYADPTPEARLGAIRTSAADMRREDAPQLVESLSSDDPAVRLAAIEALRRITGTTLGYRASARTHERVEAIERWKAWVRDQGLAPAAALPTTATIAPKGGESPTPGPAPAPNADPAKPAIPPPPPSR